jgi:hypothetical protein
MNRTRNECESLWVPLTDSPSDELKRFQALCSNNESGVMQVGEHTLEEDYLIILVEPEVNAVFAINLETTAKFPIRLNYDELREQINEGAIELTKYEFDPKITASQGELTEKQQARVNERYKAIQPLILDLEDTLVSGYGSNVFTNAATAVNRGTPYIYNTFYSFLRNGCRKSGLIMPQGKDANYFPEARKVKKKLGRATAKKQGIVLRDVDFKIFQKYKKRYAETAGLSINQTVNDMWEEEYSYGKTLLSVAESRRTGTKYKIDLWPADQRPTYNQFYHWLMKEYDGVLPRRDRKKYNRTEWAASMAGRSGNHGLWVTGPGEVYQVDETPFDEEAVSIFDESRQTKIGKPTFYFMKDMFSKAIVSCYITTQSPSYDTLKEVLFNAGRDKQSWLNELGIPIDGDVWKMKGMPLTVLADRAELHNKLSEGPITADVPITVKFTRAGRGDDKGDVEKAFDLWSQFFKGLSPAHQTKSRREIAKQLARKNACLTIPELYEIAMVYIIHYNNTNELTDYPLTKQMKLDGVEPIPAQLWDWGMKYRPGYIQDIPENQLYLDLLELGDVTVYQDHVYLKKHKLKYVCQWTLEKGHQDTRRGQKLKTFKCRMHRGCVDFIFLDTEEGLQIATLHNSHNSYIGLGFDEVKLERDFEKMKEDERKEKALTSKINATYFLKDKLRKAISQRMPAPMQDIQKIRENRKFEEMFERNVQANRLYIAACGTTDSYKHLTESINEVEDQAYSEFDN